MAKLLDRLGDALFKEPTKWVVVHEEEGYIDDVSIERTTENISSHELSITLKRPVREGNIISHLNLIDDEGNVLETFELPAGARNLGFFLNPDNRGPMTQGPIKMVTVDDEENIYAVDRFRLRKE